MDAFGRTQKVKKRQHSSVAEAKKDVDLVTKRYVDSVTIPRTKEMNYDFQGKRITNIHDPTQPGDAASKKYVDLYRLRRSKGDYDAQKRRLVNMADPVDKQDACTKAYLMANTIINEGNKYNMKNRQVKNVAAPTDENDATTKKYVDHRILGAIKIVPALTTKGFDAREQRIINLNDPVDDTDACTKRYVREQVEKLLDSRR